MKSKCVVPCVRVFRGVNPKTWGSIGCEQAPAGAARDSKKRWPRLHLEVRYSFRTSSLVFLAQLAEHRTFNARVPSSNLGGNTTWRYRLMARSRPFQGWNGEFNPPYRYHPVAHIISGSNCGNVRIRIILAANCNGLIIIFLTKCARCTPITSGTRRAQTGRSELEFILEW